MGKCEKNCFIVQLYVSAYMLSFRNANAGDLYVNRRGSGYRRVVCKLEGLGCQRIVCKLEGLRVSENCTSIRVFHILATHKITTISASVPTALHMNY